MATNVATAYAMVVNEQYNPNTSKHTHWKNTANAVGNDTKLWAIAPYNRKKVNNKYVYTTPWIVTAHDFRLNIPTNAYIRKVTFEVNMKCSAGLKVKAPVLAFMIYGAKGTVTHPNVPLIGGGYSKHYVAASNNYLSSTARTFSYSMSETVWKKAKYPAVSLNKTIMGVDMVFPEPIAMNSSTKNIAINWVRIKVEYDMPDLYVIYGTEYRAGSNPKQVKTGSTHTMSLQFGNRTNAVAGWKNINIQLPKNTTLVSYKEDTGSTFEVIDEFAGKYRWKCNGKAKAKVNLKLTLRHSTTGFKRIISTLDNVPFYGYVSSIGSIDDFEYMEITCEDVHKGEVSCFDFRVKAFSVDGTVSYDVVVDGEGQSVPSHLSDEFKRVYNNPNGTSNNLVGWSLLDAAVSSDLGFDEDDDDVSIDWNNTTNDRITFNIPARKNMEIAFRGCFIPVTLGANTLNCTDGDTGQTFTCPYTSLAQSNTPNFISDQNDATTTWYDHWITTRTETGAFIIPFVSKMSDRVMYEGEGTMTMSFEKPQAYIGCVPLKHSHYKPQSDFTNKIISEQYKNKKYMGKTGEIDEQISFKLKLPPGDWSTLQGLCELDKPVPVNAVPRAFEGDVLNHRGWVELGGVKNVEKTNPLYYDGELDVDYLTHNINTLFKISRGKRISKYTTNVLNSLLDYVVESGDEFADYYHTDDSGKLVRNDTGFFNVDTDGVYIYDDDMPNNQRTLISLANNQHVTMKSISPLRNNAEINFEWSSTKIQENRENNLQRIIRLLNKTGEIILEYEYYDYDFNADDELYSCSVKCTKLDKNTGEQVSVIETDDLNFAVDFEALSLKVDEFGNLVQEVEPDEEETEGEEGEGTYIDPITGEEVDVVSDLEVYNDYMFGSTLTFELKGNILDINDTGFNGSEVHVEDIELEADEYYLEVEYTNRNVDSDTPDVLHFFDFEILEPRLASDFGKLYDDIVVASHPVQDKEFVFLRNSEEGTLYYYTNDGKPFTYIQEPFYMYARGVDLKANNNISIFNLNNSYSTFYLQNGLVRCGFNRYSSRVYIAKYDLQMGDYVTVATLQMTKSADYNIGAFSDDKIEVIYDKVVFTMYRGHPYVTIQHSKDAIDFITTWNKVYADGIDDVTDDLPVLWDLLNHENILPDCVGGLDLKSSCVEIEEVENPDVGTLPTLSVSRVDSGTVYDHDDVFFEVNGTVSNVDEEIPIGIRHNGIFGTYSSSLVIDESMVTYIDLSSDRSVTPEGEPFSIRAKVTNKDNKGISNVKVKFYEE